MCGIPSGWPVVVMVGDPGSGLFHFRVFLGFAWAWRCCSLPLPTFVRDPHPAHGPRRAELAPIGDLGDEQGWRRGPGLHAEKGRGRWAAS